MKLQKVLSLVRKAVEDYQMIAAGDVVAVGISGGKDSLTLLQALSELKRFYPQPYTLRAITVDLGFDNMRLDKISDLCAGFNVPYDIIKTDIADVVFEKRHEQNPCSLCSKMRKGALGRFAREAGINKIAYGHHRDDVIETLMLSLIYEGRLNTFAPVTYLDRTDIHIIRPLLYMEEADVQGFVNKYALPVVKSPCPVDGHTKREYIKGLISDLNTVHPGLHGRMFTAVKNSKIAGWERNPPRQGIPH